MFDIYCYLKFEDIKHIDKVYLLIQEQMMHIKSEKSIDCIEQALRNALAEGKRARLVVCYEKEEPIGFVFGNICSGIESEGDYFWMNEIHVKEDQRKKDVAKKMIRYLEIILKEEKMKCILGVTGKQNEAGQKVFIKLGFDEESVILIDKYLS